MQIHARPIPDLKDAVTERYRTLVRHYEHEGQSMAEASLRAEREVLTEVLQHLRKVVEA